LCFKKVNQPAPERIIKSFFSTCDNLKDFSLILITKV
jgi:hypothetical protein